MEVNDAPEQESASQEAAEKDPLAHFRSWRGFLFAAIVLNALFVYGMLGGVSDPSVAGWVKALSWLPFNVIASVLYFVFLVKLTKAEEECAKAAGGADQAGTHGALYAVLCLAMITLNWIAMLTA